MHLESTSLLAFHAGWLRGFFDGEGSVSFRKQNGGRKHTTYYLSVTNTDPELMDTCRHHLTELGIEFREWDVKRRQRCKQAFTLHITRAESIRIFQAEVGFSAPAKRERLEQIMQWIDRPTIGELLLPHIKKLYAAGHSLRCIGTQLGYKEGFHSRFRDLLLSADVPISRRRKHCCV